MGYLVFFILVGYSLICLVLYLYQERFIFFPEKLADDYQFSFKEDFEEVYIENNAQDDKLHGLWFKSKKGLATHLVLYFHGNAGSLVGWGNIAQDFVPLGYDVLVIDYRTYGKSSGTISQQGLFDDAKKTLAFAKKHYQEDKITVLGRSIGTGIATYIAAESKVERLILETPYYNFTTLVQHHLRIFPAFLLLRYALKSHVYITKVSCPIYIFHGTNDKTIPYKFGKQLAATIPTEHFITISNGGHNDLRSSPLYQQKMKEIMQRSYKDTRNDK